MDFITSQLLEEALANVNITTALGLMAVGFLIKHVKFLEKLDNNLIPPILLTLSIIAVVLTDGFTVQSIISAVVTAAVAVGLHQQGKNIFTVTIVPSLAELFKSLVGTDIEPEEDEIIVDEE